MDINIHSFMIAVQFHPERLGKDNLIHRHIRSNFLHAISN
jgi:gamma-glutamyl-gamma-aminobutyrate hydrolase PuuD